MAKTKILVCNVLESSDEFDVVYAQINDGNEKRIIQICMPKYCNMPSLIGKEVYYEVENGTVRVSRVKQHKQSDDIATDVVEYPEE